MARLAVFIDRPLSDREWKGAFAWKIALALAESQHEVLALTTEDPARIELSHPRMTVVRPAPAFSARYFPDWIRALLPFNPDVIHTFALKHPPLLSVWPLINLALAPWPRLRRYSSAFDNRDFLPFERVDLPFEMDLNPAVSTSPITLERPLILIPEAVSRWARPNSDLILLSEFLLKNREYDCHIVGGWGDTVLSDRRTGWSLLRDVGEQVRMADEASLFDFLKLAATSSGLWLRSMRPESWPARLAAHLGRSWSLTTWGEVPEIPTGSPANFLSRLYTQG